MSDERLESLGKQVSDQVPGQGSPRDLQQPPLHLWQPALSGDIDIVIHRDGSWSHEGDPIRRQALVRLFASILRREADGDYYLVTPVEKWRIRVEGLPLQIVDFDSVSDDQGRPGIEVTTNTLRRYPVGRDYPLFFAEVAGEKVPAVGLDYGLAAQFTRAAWYRLADACEEREGVAGIPSGGLFFPLQAD